MREFAAVVDLALLSKTAFYEHSNRYINPAIKEIYKSQQAEVMGRIAVMYRKKELQAFVFEFYQYLFRRMLARMRPMDSTIRLATTQRCVRFL